MHVYYTFAAISEIEQTCLKGTQACLAPGTALSQRVELSLDVQLACD